MSDCCVPGENLAYLAATTAAFLSNSLNANEINVLSSFLNAVADSLDLIAAQRLACEEKA